MPKNFVSLWMLSNSRSAIAVALGFLVHIGVATASDCIAPSGSAVAAVTLRTSPTAKSTANGKLESGQTLPLIASMPGWYETQLANGQTAFASKRSTEVIACPEGSANVLTVPEVQYELHAIDVGTGLSVLVRGPDFALLYDAGSNDDMARGDNNRTLAYLNTLQPPIQKLSHVILSHPHRDHVELLPDVVTRLKPSNVWNSGAYNDICGYRNFLFAIAADPSIQYHTATQDEGNESIEMAAKNCYGDKQPSQTLTLNHGKKITNEKISLGQGASMTFLFVDGSPRSSLNENSLAVRLDLGTHKILLMGDAEAGGRNLPSTTPKESSIEGKLLACCTEELKADILVVGHHGSKTSSRKKFLDAVGAKTFIVSAGPTKYATVVLPDQEIITELEKLGQVFRTDLEDASCLMSPDKVGADSDGKPGGCDNVFVKIPVSKSISINYRRISD
ncbi:MBL fold metallo-hydrolase [Undibacterium flavidum]|uniref:MBL fold metallo-hydrolase n=1 Tax=Undibacterium flavidum TaxID=2762297 RepID=A0ABR6YA25_9BURK|nr:MBL fold metallo-hydrolase [Undibacterium flavidum]MBC3873492.1 MBL fold metallo-hydrolase [Undibacterium flavidum]